MGCLHYFTRLIKNKWWFFLIIFVIGLITHFNYEHKSSFVAKSTKVKVIVPPDNTTGPEGFIIWQPNCKLPNLDPFNDEVMNLLYKEDLKKCMDDKRALTSIRQDYRKNLVTLVFHPENLPYFMRKMFTQFECCYEEVLRIGEYADADKSFNLSECVTFSGTVDLPPEVNSILVKCTATNSRRKKIIYRNGHVVIRQMPQIRQRLDSFKKTSKKRPLSVLIMGIDTVSRMHLYRAMPQTTQYLLNTGWFELRGYNKVAEKTIDNLMALLVGYGTDLMFEICNPYKTGELDDCPFLWGYFRDGGYVTGLAEDMQKKSTFNYAKEGFIRQPTDTYLRPFFLALEQYLPSQTQDNFLVCLGYKLYSDYIYQSALDFASAYLTDPHFGLFWTNAFSHDNINLVFSMDLNMKSHLEELDRRGILEHDMVIFMSDHGDRFGPILKTESGWYEDRMPFMFIWLPEWFRNEHPNFARALKINRNRLTTALDLHTTLKHVLELSGRIEKLPPSITCPRAQTLFHEVPLSRSCEDACIPNHYCTCEYFEVINVNSTIVKKGVSFVLDDINKRLMNYKMKSRPCAFLTLSKITKAKVTVFNETENPFNDYRLVFEVDPSKAVFGTTVRYYIISSKFEISGDVSRMNAYGTQSNCMPNWTLKNFCYCV